MDLNLVKKLVISSSLIRGLGPRSSVISLTKSLKKAIESRRYNGGLHEPAFELFKSFCDLNLNRMRQFLQLGFCRFLDPRNHQKRNQIYLWLSLVVFFDQIPKRDDIVMHLFAFRRVYQIAFSSKRLFPSLLNIIQIDFMHSFTFDRLETTFTFTEKENLVSRCFKSFICVVTQRHDFWIFRIQFDHTSSPPLRSTIENVYMQLHCLFLGNRLFVTFYEPSYLKRRIHVLLEGRVYFDFIVQLQTNLF